MVEIDKVTFSYAAADEESGRDREGGISDICLSISAGECVLLCGESGCGKTTITKLINGLIPGFDNGELSGCITVDGLKTSESALYEIAKHTTSVFQNPKSQFFNTDAESEIVFGLENQAVSEHEINLRLENAVRELDISPLLSKSLFQMSGGEKQIIAFAGAYCSDAKVVVLDEPSANLDNAAIKKISAIIEKMKAAGKTIIIAEHRISYLKDVLDTVCVVKGGRISKKYTAQDFFAMDEACRIDMGLRQFTDKSIDDIKNLVPLMKPESGHSITVTDLSLAYKRCTIATSLNFEIRSGDIVGIVGSNGVGKTTLLRCLCGIHKQKTGAVYFDGRAQSVKNRRSLCGLVMQDVNYQLFAESVEAECFLGNAELTKESVHEILSDMGLLELRHAHPQSLSGGQKQRLAIAVALASGKRILILDEPTSGLDYRNMVIFSRLLRELARKGVICILVTHDIEFLEAACNRMLLLERQTIKELVILHKK